MPLGGRSRAFSATPAIALTDFPKLVVLRQATIQRYRDFNRHRERRAGVITDGARAAAVGA
jgi:hypothetical protein